MYRGNSARVFPIIIVLVVIAIAIFALVSIGRALFGGDQANQAQVDMGRDALLNTSTNRSVRMTVRGPIVADENFRSYQITIDPSNRSLVTYSGYLEQTVDSRQHGNNSKAYEEFVYALDKANLMKGEELKDEKNDTRGVCATGKVYEFEVLDGSRTVKRLWTSTCKGATGTLKANLSQLETLFKNQLPDTKTLLRGLAL